MDSDPGIPQGVIDEAVLSGVNFVVREGKQSDMQQALSSASGLPKLACEKAIEWDKRVQLAVSEGKELDQAMEIAYGQTFDDMLASKLLAPVCRFLREYSANATDQTDAFFVEKRDMLTIAKAKPPALPEDS